MSFRVFKDNVLSLNGWRMCNADECVWVTIPGSNNVSVQVRRGIPEIILSAFLARFNEVIEPLRDADTACWTVDNDVATSQHPAGVAVDCNWGLHPFHAYGTFGDRLSTLRHLLDVEFRGCIGWGGDWGGNPQDEMHFEVAHREGFLDDNGNFVLDVDQRLIDLANDLRAAQPQIDLTAVLADAMMNTAGVDYGQFVPAVSKCLRDCDCTTVKRIAMWYAQVGHESAGLKYMREIASGAEYEGRDDLGNTQPGDGVRFAGRGPIQVTGRHNYTVLSQWAHGNGLAPTPTFFVDHPEELERPEYGFIGVTWYWTTQRPMNDAADAGDLVRATQYVNGGQHGIDDRRNRYNHALAMGDQLLALTTGTRPPQGDDELSAEAERMIREMYDEYKATRRGPTRSFFGETEAGVETPLGYLWNIDANVWNQQITWGYLLGVKRAEEFVTRVAQAGVAPESWAGKLTDAQGHWLGEFGQQWCVGLIALRSAMQKAFKAAGVPQTITSEAVPPTVTAVVDTRELTAAYNEIARLREENARLQQPVSQPVSTEVATVGGSTGDVAKTVVDAVEDWTDHALSMDTKQRAALTASIKVLEMNGKQ